MWFWKQGYSFLMFTRLYFLWSRFYRWLYHRKYKNYTVSADLKPGTATAMAKKLTWTKDGKRELWDAVGSPHWVAYCISEVSKGRPQPKGALDCDEFAVWCAASIRPEYHPKVISVSWMSDKKRTGGHNLCLFERDGGYFHTGNWGKHGPFVDRSATILDVLERVHLTEDKLIGWALYRPNLKLIAYGTEV